MKKLWSVILIFCFFIASCTTNSPTIQKQITHIRFLEDFIRVTIDNRVYNLTSKDEKTVIQFKEFYKNYHRKVSKQALILNKLTQQSGEINYSLFIDTLQLSTNEKVELEKVYQAKIYQGQYVMVNFMAKADTYIHAPKLSEEYKLEQPIPITITDNIPFHETSSGMVLLVLTMPVWVPFALLFGLKP